MVFSPIFQTCKFEKYHINDSVMKPGKKKWLEKFLVTTGVCHVATGEWIKTVGYVQCDDEL